MKNIKSILNKNIEIVVVFSLFIIVIIILLISGINNNFIKEGKLYITEIMAKNTYTYKVDNEYYDYIEIYNGYSNDINLEGFHLSDSEYETNRWTFPNITIKSNEYLIVYASGKDNCNNNVCHTNFKLSSKGEIITLSDNNGNIINKFSYPALSNDLAFGYINRKYTLLDKPTPKEENSLEYKYSKLSKDDLYINEYMSSNKRNYSNSLGKYDDFVEIYNNLDSDLAIHNIYLSDDIDNLIKYKLPDVTIKKKDYLLIYLSDESRVIDNEIYANFKLGEDDEYLIISDGKNIIEKIELVSLIDNVSYGRIGDKWFYFTKSTPGYENNTIGLEKINYGKESSK